LRKEVVTGWTWRTPQDPGKNGSLSREEAEGKTKAEVEVSPTYQIPEGSPPGVSREMVTPRGRGVYVVSELWEMVEKLEPMELAWCAACPHFKTARCPRKETDAQAMECSPRTDTRQALRYLERELESRGQQEMF